MNPLVVGLGNVHRGDDAVGPVVARRVGARVGAPVEVVETDDPAGLLDLWAGREPVVVVDAMRSHGRPGAVATFDVASSRLPSNGWSAGGTHALGLAEVVELGRALGRLPTRLVVVGVEVAATEASAAMTAEVERGASRAVDVVLEALAGDPA